MKRALGVNKEVLSLKLASLFRDRVKVTYVVTGPILAFVVELGF